MKPWTSPRALLACCALAFAAPGCGSPSDDPPAEGETEGAETEAPETEGAQTEGPETEGADTDTGGEVPLPNDCSCYNPAVDVELDFQEECLSVEQALPGCSTEASPCETIAEADGDSGGDAEVSPAGAVTCLAEQLAAGNTPTFETGSTWFNGDESNRYVPLADGRYVRFHCSFLDNPPAFQSVSTYALAEPTYFAACIEDNPDDEVALLECLKAGLLDASASMPACGAS